MDPPVRRSESDPALWVLAVSLWDHSPDLDSSPWHFVAAKGSLAGFEVIDPVIGGLGWPVPGAEPKDAVHGIQRRFDQVVEVPDLVGVARLRRTKFDADREAFRPRPQAGPGDRFADSGLPRRLSRGRVARRPA
jgi:hypothetical protein